MTAAKIYQPESKTVHSATKSSDAHSKRSLSVSARVHGINSWELPNFLPHALQQLWQGGMTGSECSSFSFQPSGLERILSFGLPFATKIKERQSDTAADFIAPVKAQEHTKGKHERGQRLTDIVGHYIQIPGDVFGVNVPGLFYKARVMKKDSSHANAVTVRCVDDSSKYWLPVEDVRQFVQEEKERQHECEEKGDANACTGTASDQYAASVLVSMSGDRSAHSQSVETRHEEIQSTSQEPQSHRVYSEQRGTRSL